MANPIFKNRLLRMYDASYLTQSQASDDPFFSAPQLMDVNLFDSVKRF